MKLNESQLRRLIRGLITEQSQVIAYENAGQGAGAIVWEFRINGEVIDLNQYLTDMGYFNDQYEIADDDVDLVNVVMDLLRGHGVTHVQSNNADVVRNPGQIIPVEQYEQEVRDAFDYGI